MSLDVFHLLNFPNFLVKIKNRLLRVKFRGFLPLFGFRKSMTAVFGHILNDGVEWNSTT